MSWPARIIHWSFYALFITVPLIFLPNTSELFEFNKIIVTYLLTTIIASAWISDCILQKKFVFRRSLPDIPLVLFLSISFLSLVFSINIHTSWFGYYSRFNGGLASLICYSLLYWAFVTYMDKKSTLTALYLALTTATLVSLWGVAEHFGVDASKWVQDVQNRVFSTLGQPNWLAAYLVALIFIPLSQMLTSKKLSIKYLTLSILFFVTLLFTKSRSGLLAFGLSSIIFWAITILKSRQLNIKNLTLNILSFTLIALAFTLIIPNPIRDLIQSKFRQTSPAPSAQPSGPALETGGTESGAIRKIVWTGAIRIWLDGPKNFLLGSGPETFAMAYYQHRPVEHNNTSEWELLYNKAHNEFLNYLSNNGLLGLLSYLVLLTFMGWTILSNTFRQPSQGALYAALLAGWFSLSVTNFWGFSVVIVQIFLFLLPAMASTLDQERPRVEQSKGITKKQIFSILLFSFSPFLFISYAIARYFLSDVNFASGAHDLRAFTTTQDPQYLLSSYQSFDTSFGLNSQEPAISSEFSTVAAYLSVVSTNASLSAQLASQALALSDSSIAQNPHHPNYLKNRSRMFLILASTDPKYYAQADAALVQAGKISPTDPRLPLNRAKIALYQKDPLLARKYFDQALKLKPDLSPQVQYELDQYSSSSAKISP